MADAISPEDRKEAAKRRFTWQPGDVQFIKLTRRKKRRKRKAKAKKYDSDTMLSEERAAQILMEETVARRPRTLDTSDEEREYRAGIKRDVAKMKAAGIEIVVPTSQPG